LDFVAALRRFLVDNDPPRRVQEILLAPATKEK